MTAGPRRRQRAQPAAAGALQRARAAWLDTRGGSAVEYLILVGLVALLAIGAVARFGGEVQDTAERQAACIAALDAAGCEGERQEDLAASAKAAAPSQAPAAPLDEPGVFGALQSGLRLGGGPDGKVCVGNACVGGNCFVAGTVVATPDGGRSIETLRPGDLVTSVDPASGEVVERPVARTFITPRREVLRVRVGAGALAEEIGVTGAHRFWVEGHGWTEAADLGAGVRGVSASGAALALAALPGEAAEATVYNLEVEGTHTYFVGQSRALVHNDCIEDAKTGELYDPKRRAATEKLAEWGPYNDETFLLMANAVFGERQAKDAFKKTKWDLHQAKQIPFDAYWFHHKETEKADWFPNSWKALRQALFEGHPGATAAVKRIVAAADQAGVDPDWGGERLREAKRLIARNTPPPGSGNFQKFILPEIPKEVRDDLNIDLQLGIADWWSKLDDGRRNAVNDALRELGDKRKQRKLLVELATDEIAKKVGDQPPAKYDGWIDKLPPPIANGVGEMSELKRAVMGHAWDRLDNRDFEAIKSELWGMIDRGASNKAMAGTLYNRLVPSNVSTSRLLRYEISVRDGEMSVPAYTELLARQIPAMAKKEQKEAAAEEASRKADLIARMQKIMGDPGLAKRGQRDAKTMEVYGRSDAARLGHTALGFGKQGVDTVVGIGEIVIHPIQTAKGLWFAVSNPDKSIPALLVSIDESYHDDPDQFLGRVTFEITLAAATAGGGEAVSAADKARKMARLAKEAHAAGDLMKAIRYAEAAEDLARKAEKVADASKAAKAGEAAKTASEARAAANAANIVAGAAKTDLVARAQKVLELAEAAHPKYAPKLEAAKKAVKDALGDFGQVGGRAKDPVSAANRLERAIDRFGAKIEKLDDVLPNLWDAIGTRLIIENTADIAQIDKLVDRLAKAIKDGELVVTEINNLHGPGGKPYFSAAQLERIQQAAAAAGKPLKINTSKLMDSGYTVVTVYTHHGGGVRGELQIIGKKALELADVEHIPYDLSLGKPLVRAIPPDAVADMQKIVGPVEDAVRGWSTEKWAKYNAYLNDAYIQARNQELGLPTKPVKLPDGFPEVVSVDGLKRVHGQIDELKKSIGGGGASGASPKARLESIVPPAGALTPSQMPRKLATALTPVEAAEAAKYADELGRIAGNIEKNPLGTAKELADLKWDKVKVSWDKPIEKGQSEFTRLGEEAKKLAKEAGVPEKAALDYLIDEKFNDMLKVQQAYYHDPRTGVTHVPRDFIVYKDGIKRPLDLTNPIEKAWAERHARALVEEYAHGAGSAVRAGEYTPLTPKLGEFQKWLGDARNRPLLEKSFTKDELAEMAGHMHEADITALLQGRSPHSAGELGRYKIREAYQEFLRQPPP